MPALRLRFVLGLSLLVLEATSASAQLTSGIEMRAHASGPAEVQDWRGASLLGATVRLDRPYWSLETNGALNGGEDRWWGTGSFSALIKSPSVGPLQLSISGSAARDGRFGVMHDELTARARASLRFGNRGVWFGADAMSIAGGEVAPTPVTPSLGAWQQLGGAILSVQLAPRRARSQSQSAQVRMRRDSIFTDSVGWEFFQVPDTIFGSALQSWSDAEARLVWARGRWAFDASVGTRLLASGLERSAWGQVHGLYALSSRLALVASAGNLPADPIRGWERQGFATLGVRLLGAPEPRGDLDATVRPGAADFGIEPTRSGEHLLRVRVPHARTVELSGTFTNWQPIALTRVSADWWQLSTEIPPGTHQISIRVNGDAWRAPPGLATIEDEFNGTVGLLVVE